MSGPIAATPDAPLCAGPDALTRVPRLSLPPGSCDSHAHICGPVSRYPYSAERIYTPPDALLAHYRKMLETLGVERGVLVQPSVYGSDNRALLDALAHAGPSFRGVAVIEPTCTDAQLRDMHAAGIRGVRINIVDRKQGKGELPLAELHSLAERIGPYGWHIELLMHVDAFPDLARDLGDVPVPLVFGHLGYVRPGCPVDDPGFMGLLDLMREGRAWAKLTGPYRISTQALPYPDTTARARILVDAAPTQVIWGSDWPHVMVKGVMPNDGELCDLLVDWVPDVARRRQVLVDNPARLYGFPALS